MALQNGDYYVNLADVDLHCQVSGEGPPLIFLHGLASNLKIWDLMRPLLNARYTVITVDQRGHGLSSKPNTGYDFNTIVEDLHKFMEKLEITQPILIGHSWGADVVLEFGAKHPCKIRGIVMVDGGTIQPSAREGWTLEIAKQEMAPPKFTGLTEEGLRARFSTRNGGVLANIDGAFDAVRGNFNSDRGVLSPNLSLENHLAIIEALWNHYPSELYKVMQVPCLFFPASPDEDPNQSYWVNRKSHYLSLAEQHIPKCVVHWFTNSIHDVPLQRPEEMTEVLNRYIDQGFFDSGEE